jgi:murein hydrolase activator
VRVQLSVLAIFAATLISPLLAFTQEETVAPQSRLEQITTRVKEEDSRLIKLQEKQKQLLQEEKTLASSIKDLRKALEQAKQRLTELEKERSEIDADMRKTDKKILDLQVITMQRVRSLAMQQRDRLFEKLILKGSTQNFSRQIVYLNKLRQYDRDLNRELHKLFAERRDYKIVVQSLFDQQKKVETDLDAKQLSISQKITRLDQVKRSIISEQKAAEDILAELKAEALRLETVMVGLTGGETQILVQEDAELQQSEQVIDTAFVGKGLKSKGHSRPVEGKIIISYGSRSKKGFEKLLKSQGIEILAPEGAGIKAIETGKVIFSGSMPGYDNIIILDHGDREYTLYGRILDPHVKVGMVVQRGDQIALTGTVQEGESNFYFEIRKNGKSLNPGLFVEQY